MICKRDQTHVFGIFCEYILRINIYYIIFRMLILFESPSVFASTGFSFKLIETVSENTFMIKDRRREILLEIQISK